jgi:uncharacterized membrane protein YidH (DUF202 family)
MMRRFRLGDHVQYLSRAVFGLASFALMVLAFAMILRGLYEPVIGFWESGEKGKTALLGAIGYIIIAIAVFDVAKFLYEEEVLETREKREAGEARRSLTSFISTIAVAVFLESLVTVFRVSTNTVSEMLYPTLLLVAGTLLVLGLGIYQRLSVTVERQVEAKDRAEQG